MTLELGVACGQLLVGGFDGTSLPARVARALGAGELGGVILFRRNIARAGDADDAVAVAALNASVARAAPDEAPPLVAIDQEGGRVARLKAPMVELPPMRAFGTRGDATLVERAARAQARELVALGFTMNFAPVLDVDTNPANPVIGDRSFSRDPAVVARLGAAWIRGAQREGLLACGKHFPGHGDTAIDSHLDLPVIEHPRARLEQTELVPFREAARAGVAAIMTAHVVVRAIDPEAPATLSRAVCSSLLRDTVGFGGVLVSDDLEMKAIADRTTAGDAAVRAVAAGCDLLLVCASEDKQIEARDALVREAERSDAFRDRVHDAATRVIAMRRRAPPRPRTSPDALAAALGTAEARSVVTAIGRAS